MERVGVALMALAASVAACGKLVDARPVADEPSDAAIEDAGEVDASDAGLLDLLPEHCKLHPQQACLDPVCLDWLTFDCKPVDGGPHRDCAGCNPRRMVEGCYYEPSLCTAEEACVFFDPVDCDAGCGYNQLWTPYAFVCWPRAWLPEGWEDAEP